MRLNRAHGHGGVVHDYGDDDGDDGDDGGYGDDDRNFRGGDSGLGIHGQLCAQP